MLRRGSWFDGRVSIADEKYVAFTTFRRSGDPVATPVWIAPLSGNRAGFTTGAASGKAKRLAHTSRVVLQPCSQRGVIVEGSDEVAAAARIVTGPGAESDEVRAAIKTKYGFAATAILAAGKVSRVVRRQPKDTTAIAVVVIDLIESVR